ncbi:hypothetical protein NCCP2716_14830 [Sporosarcina sp. NCCP-2716]|uniref:hypothetical protein n=1 Tax=Sporosarcina sp. NCCP-2716 TaxID=2943679 RepID=UPI00203C3B6F|nr:hypothetical protein [Sporosarcina sp. NCCP-2716]GKV68985.1 hypothetical protein NCCP2716_14830 [Sporosarcina sp. NCCP-2716]
MIRRGRFARWKGNEYEISSRNRQIYLTTTDAADLDNGFSPIGGSHLSFVRPVDMRELDDAYEIVPYAILKGHRFAIEGADSRTGLVKLVTHNPFAAKKVAVLPYGSDAYMIELPLSDIVVEEDRIPILGFENRLA